MDSFVCLFVCLISNNLVCLVRGNTFHFISKTNSPEQTILAKNSIENDRIIKRMNCISGLPGGDCENFFLGSESLGQDFLRPGGRNPGKR